MEGTEEGRKNMNKEANAEECKSGKREVAREEEKTVIKEKVCESVFLCYF